MLHAVTILTQLASIAGQLAPAFQAAGIKDTSKALAVAATVGDAVTSVKEAIAAREVMASTEDQAEIERLLTEIEGYNNAGADDIRSKIGDD